MRNNTLTKKEDEALRKTGKKFDAIYGTAGSYYELVNMVEKLKFKRLMKKGFKL